MALSGYTSSLPTDVLLDSGTLYVGATVLAATRGGIQFNPNKEMRNIEFDGKHAAIKGLDRTTTAAPMISGSVIELSPADIPVIEPGATSSTASSGITRYTGKAMGTLYAPADYLADVRCIWERGSGGYVQVRFASAIVRSWQMSGTDNEEAAIQIEIEARIDMSVSGNTVTMLPYSIDYFTTAP
jgi:hypothetical protein